MRRYRVGAHSRYDLKVHLVWVPKYRKRVLTGAVAVRARDLLRQIAAENDLHIISGKVAADHVHLFIVSVGWCSPCLGLGPFDRGLAMLDALLSRAVSSSPLPELHLFVRLWRRGDDPPEHLLELFHGHG